MRPLSILLIGVALLLLAAAPVAGWVALPNLSLPDGGVGVLNYDQNPVDLTGWTITDDGVADTYTFPHFTLAPWALVKVHPGRGTNSATDLYWGRGPGAAPAWNDDGDLVTLRDASGTRIADSRGFILGAPPLPPPPTTMPLVTLPGFVPVSPLPTPYITTPPAGAAPYGGPYGPIAPPYPTTIRTPASGPTTVPIPLGPGPIPLPTGGSRPVLQPTGSPVYPVGIPGRIAWEATSLPGGRRYAIGNPGSLLGTRFGTGGSTMPTRPVRTISTTGAVLTPGGVSYGIAPPASGSFVRWYPAARWAAGLR